jgi:nucleotide-binding universal stress UspA family protein
MKRKIKTPQIPGKCRQGRARKVNSEGDEKEQFAPFPIRRNSHYYEKGGPMYQKIMVPLDGSKLAECVFPHLNALVWGCQVKTITFVQVVELYQTPAYAAESTISAIADEMEAINKASKLGAENYLKKLGGKFKNENVDVRCEMLIGNPSEMLADYATKNQPDLILIATHGRSGPSRWVWGSVADRLLRAACVPVLMVRAPGCFPGI